MAKFPSEEQERFIVRMPDGMRELLKAAAAKNNRSMNAEVVSRLEESLDAERLSRTLAQLENVPDEKARLAIMGEAGVTRAELDGLVRAILTLPARIEALEARVGLESAEDAADAAAFDLRMAETPPGELSTDHVRKNKR